MGSVSLQEQRGHFAWATVNQFRAVTELLGESHDEAEDCVLLICASCLIRGLHKENSER